MSRPTEARPGASAPPGAPDTTASRGKSAPLPRVLLLLAALLIALATALRLWRLDAVPLWYDEAMYAWLALGFSPALLSGKDILAEPLFTWFLSLWVAAGTSDAWLRLHAAVAGIATVAAVGFLAGRLGGRRSVLPGMALATVSPILIYYSGDMKMYAWVILFQVVCMAAALSLPATKRPVLVVVVYVLAAAAYCNIVFSAPLFLAPLNFVYLFLFARHWRRLLLWLAAQGLVVLLSIPFILAELNYAEVMNARIFHALLPSWGAVWITAGNFASGYAPADGLRTATVLLLALLSTAALVVPVRGRRGAWAVALVIVLQVGLLAGLSLLGRHSVYIDRYVVGATGLWLALAARGFAMLPRWPRALGVLAGCALLTAALPPVFRGEMPEAIERRRGIIEPLDAPAMTTFLQEHAEPGAFVAHAFWETEPVLRWYAPAYRHVLVQQNDRLTSGLDLVCTRGFQAFYGWHPTDFWVLSAQGSPVWLVLPEQMAGWEWMYSSLLAAFSMQGDFIAGASFRAPHRHAAGIYGFQNRAGRAIETSRTAARLPLFSTDGTLRTAALTLHETSHGAFELVIDAPPDAAGSIEYLVLDQGCLLPVSAMIPENPASSPWTIDRRLDPSAHPFPVVNKVQNGLRQAMTAAWAVPPGRYDVYVESDSPALVDLILTVNGTVLRSTGNEASGWTWLSMGRIETGEEVAQLALDAVPDTAGAQVTVSLIAFVPEGRAAPSGEHKRLRASLHPGRIRFEAEQPTVIVSYGPYLAVLWRYARGGTLHGQDVHRKRRL